jgi:acyl carrier protein
MTGMDVYEELTRVFHHVFERDDLVLTPELTAEDVPGWNSFKQVEIILEVQERFHIRLTSKDLDHLQNVGDLARAIAAKTALKA